MHDTTEESFRGFPEGAADWGPEGQGKKNY